MTITAHQSSRAPRRALLLSLMALGALGLVACSADDDDEASATGARPSPRPKIERTANAPFMKVERTANEWASLFAAGGRTCRRMTQPACLRMNCERGGVRAPAGPRRNCTPPSPEFQKSFEGATVQDLVVTGDKAAARFSNGEAVELVFVNGYEVGGVWRVVRFGGSAGDMEFITKVGNAWAPLFAEDNSAAGEYMFGQPLVARFFGTVGQPPEVGRPSAFQESFANATVERVWVEDVRQIKTKDGTPIELHRAAAEFSNGEVVRFIEETDESILRLPSVRETPELGEWFVLDVGRKAGS